MNWKPISTAPKDGTHIIVAYAGRETFGTGRIWAEVVKWDNHYCGWSDDETEYVMSDATFTHWAPLPPVDENEDDNPMGCLHINQCSMEDAADKYASDYWAELAQQKYEADNYRYAAQDVRYYVADAISRMLAATKQTREQK